MLDAHTVSPLLDAFTLGEPFSRHHGIVCCPAIHSVTKEKFILKVISIPESQIQVEAMLLTGACADREAAQAYYAETAQDLIREAEILQKLSRSRCFVPFYAHQIVPKQDGETGVDLYILSPFRTTLDAYTRQTPMTHLAAVNLGIDICAALTTARKHGYLLLDLKPGNIVVTAQRQFQIADFGLLDISGMDYATFPDKYRSSYTAPELFDDFAPLNETVDVYGLGMILHRIFNCGENPFSSDSETRRLAGEHIPAPCAADLEMSAIISRAVAYQPQDRWQSPEEMGSAIIAYLQTHAVNDDPLVPPAKPEPIPAPAPKSESQEPAVEVSGSQGPEPQEEATPVSIPAEAPTADVIPIPDAPSPVSVPADVDAEAEAPEKIPAAVVAPILTAAPAEVPAEEMTPVPAVSGEVPKEVPAPQVDAVPTVPEAPVEIPEKSEEDWMKARYQKNNGEPRQGALRGPVPEVTIMSQDELDDILLRADSFLTPAAPEAPESGAEAPAGAPEDSKENTAPVPEAPNTPETPKAAEPDAKVDDEDDDDEYDEDDDEAPERTRRSYSGLAATLISLILVAALVLGGLVFYSVYYNVPVNALTVEETGLDSLTVCVDTKSPELYLLCQDTYGNTIKGIPQDGKVTFTGLNPDTQYNITAAIDGFHKLSGTTQVSCTTGTQTEIVDFSSMIGAEDGSAVLYFTINGTEPSQWVLHYSTEGEDERTRTFTGHTVSVSGLTVGKDYTFRLEASDGIFLIGMDEITVTASTVILAQGLRVTSYGDDSVTVVWESPVEEPLTWTVRAYNQEDFSEITTVSECTATISGLDFTTANTVEVTAEGMTQSTWIAMTAAPACLSGCTVNLDTPGQMTVGWTLTGTAPAQWIFLYSYGNDAASIEPVVTGEASAVVSPMLPGTNYVFQIQSATGSTVYNNTFSASIPEASPFLGYGVTGLSLNTYEVPTEPEPEEGAEETDEEEEWTWGLADLTEELEKSAFSTDETLVFVLTAEGELHDTDSVFTTMILIRDENGVPLDYVLGEMAWNEMWYENHYVCEITRLPDTTGNYTLEVYLNSQLAGTAPFTIQ